MSDSLTRDEVIRQIAEAFADLPGGRDDPAFIERYFRHVPLDELAERPRRRMAGAAAAHLALAQDRVAGTSKVRIFNPSVETDGWSSPNSVAMVVTDDMPFLVDSVTGCLVTEGYDVLLVVHPQLTARRDAMGRLDAITDSDPSARGAARSVGEIAESWMLLSFNREPDPARRAALEDHIADALRDVRESVEDWPKMRTKCLVLAAELEGAPPRGVDATEVRQAVAFLRWMTDNHFTYLGYREFRLEDTEAGEALVPIPSSGLGILRADPALGRPRVPLGGEALARAREPRLLILTKANSMSTVHRRAYLDYVGIKVFDATGEVVGERRFLGLYAATAYTESVTRIPVVADKVATIVARSGVAPNSHIGKDLMGVLESYPRDEMFQGSVDELCDIALAVTALQGRRRTKLFLREDLYGRFVSCLVYIPRDRYNTSVRTRMADILQRTFGGESVEFAARVSESALSRLQFIVHMPKDVRVRHLSEEETAALERELVSVSRVWTDRLDDGIRARFGDTEGDRLMHLFGHGFPTAYEETFTVSQGIADLRHLDRLGPERRTSVALYRPAEAPATVRRFKLFRADPLSLTNILPIFTHMGVEVVDEQPYAITRSDGAELHVYDFGLRVADAAIWESLPHEELRDLFEGAVLAVWDGQAESDGLNQLILGARLTWRQVVVLRAVARYLRQARTLFSPSYVEGALVSNPQTARDLVELFEAKFDPTRFGGVAGQERGAAAAAIVARIVADLDSVASLDHDRIIRSFLSVISAALRTNFYQAGPVPGGASEPLPHKAYISMKLNPRAIPDLPAPRPQHEIWVYSPRVEGLHLRFGAVARGGLRWSDRREDFRTEILGLVKAQMVKNAVIVPTGSKGGFFAKQLPDPITDRDAWLAEGIEAYRLFVSGLLDLTDNRVGNDVIPPASVVRHDGDDTYLVVAADKGTATFSDIANGVARSYGFWLDDAFASGGSAGYDHKEMGITARGAWESVKRHFREMGTDTQTEDFTCVGIGDMSGDVFGNGMLLSEHIRLVAAFDHRHIFVDPDPDPARSFLERRRLFDLPRSSWADYDATLLSEGGGIFSRALKAVPVTPQMTAALGLPEDTTAMTPAELIHAILLAPVDLLWNGGIGTYVKSSAEDKVDIGDRANDAIRVDGNELRCKVVGEGGNLGLSQLGRIEASFHGVRVNTDAIDNSAGVDTSDHEVNIKIPLADLVRAGALTMDDRNAFLHSMTDEVAAQVLRDNYEQNVLLGNARTRAQAMVHVHQRLIHWLEERGDLDRALEFLPSGGELMKRAKEGEGLKSPELSVLVAYAKLALKEDLLASDLPDDPWLIGTLAGYFPEPMRTAYSDQVAGHPLRREIITNAVANAVVNAGGITFAFRAMEETGASAAQVARAFLVCREVFGLDGFAGRVEALDDVLSTGAQTELYLEFRRLIDRAVRWFIHVRPRTLDIGGEIERFGDLVRAWAPRVPTLLRGEERARLERRVAEMERDGVPEELAREAGALLDEYSLLDISDLATTSGEGIETVAPLYYAVSETFGIDAMLSRVSRLPREDQWDALARAAVRDDLYGVLETITRAVLDATRGHAAARPQDRVDLWNEANADAVGRATAALSGITALDAPNLAALSVALRTLRGVVRGGALS